LFATAQYAGADESSYMREVLRRFPLPLETVAMEDYWAFRPHPILEQFQDEPFEPVYGSRVIAELEIARRLGSEVILSGDGGDEVGGTSLYLAGLLLRGQFSGLWGELQRRAAGKRVPAWRLAFTLARMYAGWWRRRLAPRRRPAPTWASRALLRRTGLDSRRREESPMGSLPRDMQYRMLETWRRSPPPNRRLYAQVGVEVRCPFLDRRLFEWALMTPPHLLGEEGCVKAPLRRALADLMPSAVNRRSDKGNYLPYWDLGVRDKERRRIEELLDRPLAAELGYLDADRLRLAYRAYCSGKPIHRACFWNALTLEKWLRLRARS
jgi:asparagine synthase (glutamine-hydrolysing)